MLPTNMTPTKLSPCPNIQTQFRAPFSKEEDFLGDDPMSTTNDRIIHSSPIENQIVELNKVRDFFYKWVLTGGPGAGKTTILEELRKKGFNVIGETYTLVFNQSKINSDIQKLFENSALLQNHLLNTQLSLENIRNKKSPIFCDRSTIDISAYYDLFDNPETNPIKNDALANKYDFVFHVGPLPFSCYQQTEVRTEGFEHSKKLGKFLETKYNQAGYTKNSIHVPSIGPDGNVLSPAKRAQYILDFLTHVYQPGIVINCFSGFTRAFDIQSISPDLNLIRITNPTADSTQYFFGIEQEKHSSIYFEGLKKSIFDAIQREYGSALHLIGDNKPFSSEGSSFAMELLLPEFKNAKLIQYDYISNSSDDQFDTNGLLNQYLKENPDQGEKVLANIVGQTHRALTKEGASASRHVKNFMVLYNNQSLDLSPIYDSVKCEKYGGCTTFGDDFTIVSSFLHSEDEDQLICLEGGVDSFPYVLNALSRDIPVTLVYNLRKSDSENFFSTSYFLANIRHLFEEKKQELTKDEIRVIFDKYLNNLSDLWDFSNPKDIIAKSNFDKGFNDFVEKDFFRKVFGNFCYFQNGQTDLSSSNATSLESISSGCSHMENSQSSDMEQDA